MSTNPLFSNGEENEKVIRNPHADPDHHRELITSRGAHTCQVWSTSVSAFVSYHVYRMTERMRELKKDTRWSACTSNKSVWTAHWLSE